MHKIPPTTPQQQRGIKRSAPTASPPLSTNGQQQQQGGPLKRARVVREEPQHQVSLIATTSTSTSRPSDDEVVGLLALPSLVLTLIVDLLAHTPPTSHVPSHEYFMVREAYTKYCALKHSADDDYGDDGDDADHEETQQQDLEKHNNSNNNNNNKEEESESGACSSSEQAHGEAGSLFMHRTLSVMPKELLQLRLVHSELKQYADHLVPYFLVTRTQLYLQQHVTANLHLDDQKLMYETMRRQVNVERHKAMVEPAIRYGWRTAANEKVEAAVKIFNDSVTFCSFRRGEDYIGLSYVLDVAGAFKLAHPSSPCDELCVALRSSQGWDYRDEGWDFLPRLVVQTSSKLWQEALHIGSDLVLVAHLNKYRGDAYDDRSINKGFFTRLVAALGLADKGWGNREMFELVMVALGLVWKNDLTEIWTGIEIEGEEDQEDEEEEEEEDEKKRWQSD
eukprot:TRINITY_DN2418_c0_g1_i1.p1 TRINITY_DN2418_c0_g1~~TRINITY_DN2418_c0_g1_i1.p1  ORF type:complete len:450 (-),score=117.09 TRINITY_DN2418_c0_g1_i1:106-1455(-)